ncbi:hypothetical protein TanjilG_11607 [Lupinus angustifolius]|uniref:Glycosyl transferase family 1 domain-containing protein n=1 Tax=Lupinus angustifolius TaxID=3871 RepID=A0A1J7GNI6_LUPAN|nr:hypothetical protein TanjilG_11607 [Lupinus angustifolius]
MGSSESMIPSKKGSLFGSQPSRKEKHPFSQRFRSSFSRLMFKKLDYIQWICTVVVFLCLVVVFQMFLPISVVEKSGNSFRAVRMRSGNVSYYKDFKNYVFDIENYALDIGEDAIFVPKISEKIRRKDVGRDMNLLNQTVLHFGYRKPQLALVFGELLVDSQALLMATIAAALLEIGYGIQVFSIEDGPVRNVWISLKVPVTVIQTCGKADGAVDWLNYDGIIVSSLEAKGAFSCFLQEPFKSIPLIWIIHENSLAYRSKQYTASGKTGLLNDWRRSFNRSTVVVFPNYALPMIYSTFDAGNFYVIPGSPAESLDADAFMAIQKHDLRIRMGHGREDLVVAIVGSQFLYKGMWLGHAIVLQALSPLLADFPSGKDNSSAQLRIIVHSGELTNNYSVALETMAHSLKYPRGIIEHIAGDLNTNSVLATADVVIYGSLLEEQSFPDILTKAMCFEKPIVAPDIPMIRKYVDDRVNGYLFPKDSSRLLRQIVSEVISNGKISPQARHIASIGRSTAKNLMVSEAIEEYASLIQNILRFPSELKDRTDHSHGTWEEAYRNAKKVDRLKNDLHERDDGELERTGQPLCIMGHGREDLVVAIVGSQFLYKGMWLGHAIVLQALSPLLADFPSGKDNSSAQLRIIVHSGELTNNYSVALETMAHSLKYPRGIIEHIAGDLNTNSVLATADVVIYGSLLEEQSFPDILTKAMCFEKPIVAPDIPMIRKYVDDRVNGYLFPKDSSRLLRQIVSEVISNGKISPQARHIASIGRSTAKNLMVSEAIEEYASLIQNILRFPSEVVPPKAVSEISPNIKEQWQWHLFEADPKLTYENKTTRSHTFLDKYEDKWNLSQNNRSTIIVSSNDSFVYSIWEEEKLIQMAITTKRREDEELKDRTDHSHGTWEEAYRNAKKVDRLKNDLHERDDGELERTGQPLCMYEPYYGEGSWPFLHRRSLYRGVSLSTKGRRPGRDDVDAPSRLPLLTNTYYRDVLGEYGAFFAIANIIDRLHKNAWVGFQSWRATARKASLSRTAENALLGAIQSKKFGDALYFWVRMDTDPRNPLRKDFWSFCDTINAGNCKFAFSEAMRRMYGLKDDMHSLPPMPIDGDTWSVMQSWTLPTRSFLEFVMFSRMFVDALDMQMYDEHHSTGHCPLSLSKDKHCYSRLLELLVNVWAYHSARRMVYVNPETGVMQEQHKFKSRRGKMWIKWFSYSILKSMDEDLAELSDSRDPNRHWLWPLTGEVFWQGLYERERNLRQKQREKRKQNSLEKQDRMRRRHRQQVIGKYVKPPPEGEESSNSTLLAAKASRSTINTTLK